MKFFLVCIFLNSVRIQEDTDQKKTPYLDTFHAVKNETSNEFFFQYIVSLMPLYMYVALSLQQ